MNKTIFITSLLVLSSLATPAAQAAGDVYGSKQCQPIYGGGESCANIPQVEINKTVQNPQNQLYIDNLGVGDPKFAPTQVVPFKITVKNTSDVKLTNIVIKDVMPQVVDFSGGIGDYNKESKTLTIKLDSLEPGETRDFYVQAKVVAKDKLPADQAVVCVVNQAIVTVADKTGQDNAQFCIEKNVVTPPTTNKTTPAPTQPTTKGGVPVAQPTSNPTTTKGGLPVYPPTKAKTTPQTGPEAIALFGLIPSAVGGLFLRRKTK